MRISVCIATYNGAKYIKAQLDSILCQLSDDDEVVISDDSSTDSTVEIIKQIDDTRIKLFSGQQFKSPILNFENAISKAQGQYIFLSDQDDEWDSQKVEEMVPYLGKTMLVASYFCFINKESELIDVSRINNPKKGFIKNWIKPTIPGCCMAFTSEIKDKILPFPEGIAMHDWWITLKAAADHQISILPQPLTRIRRHDSNFSTTGSKSKFSLIQRIAMRYHILMSVIFN
jgi:glycosyltransferase involved in cell wall biosynthesis